MMTSGGDYIVRIGYPSAIAAASWSFGILACQRRHGGQKSRSPALGAYGCRARGQSACARLMGSSFPRTIWVYSIADGVVQFKIAARRFRASERLVHIASAWCEAATDATSCRRQENV
jgi:hypothetical protein